MKKNVLRTSLLPLILVAGLAFTHLPQQRGNDKGNKGNKEQAPPAGNDKGQDHKANGSQANKNNNSKGNDNDHGGGNSNAGQRGNQGNGNDNKGRDNNSDRGNSRPEKANAGKNNGHANGNMNSESRRKEVIRWDHDGNINWWNSNDFGSRKRPKDAKKVSVCHQTGSDGFPVSISVSENALQAHLNHGDQTGACAINYDRWPKNYINARENVYNSYETTWETMSYSEALLRYAAEKLLGVKTNLDRNRASLAPQEIQRREALILDLQNNVNGLQNQLGVTRQRLDNVNIVIML